MMFLWSLEGPFGSVLPFGFILPVQLMLHSIFWYLIFFCFLTFFQLYYCVYCVYLADFRHKQES